MSLKRVFWAVVVGSLLLIGCENNDPLGSVNARVPARQFDSAVVERGRGLYQTHCVICHGEQAQGDPEWRTPGPDGHHRPPPLDGSGHTWHHSEAVLLQIIANGSRPAEGNMPGWSKKLTPAEMKSIVVWVQSIWPEAVYQAWYRMTVLN